MLFLKFWVGLLVMLVVVSLLLQVVFFVKVGLKIDIEGVLFGNIILQVLESYGVLMVNKV